MQKLSYLVPVGLVGLVGVLLRPSWWALAMLAGGALFAWDWLWGDRRLLDGRYGLQAAALGCALVAAGLLLAHGMDRTVTQFMQLADGARRGERLVYLLPPMGIGTVVYGLMIWSRALARDAE